MLKQLCCTIILWKYSQNTLHVINKIIHFLCVIQSFPWVLLSMCQMWNQPWLSSSHHHHHHHHHTAFTRKVLVKSVCFYYIKRIWKNTHTSFAALMILILACKRVRRSKDTPETSYLEDFQRPAVPVRRRDILDDWASPFAKGSWCLFHSVFKHHLASSAGLLLVGLAPRRSVLFRC